jgi:hypothetical protein
MQSLVKRTGLAFFSLVTVLLIARIYELILTDINLVKGIRLYLVLEEVFTNAKVAM